MNIYLVRHGETLWNREEVFRGRKDIPLNETGRAQAEKLGAYFASISLGRVASSPLLRAVQTAEAISRSTGVPFETMGELTDINFGIWEGLPVQKVKEQYPGEFGLWKTSPQRLEISGGETLTAVRERISKSLAKVINTEGGTIAVVAHRVICKMIVLRCLNIGDEHFWDMKFDPASVTLLERKDHNFTLVFSNDTSHLRQLGLGEVNRDF